MLDLIRKKRNFIYMHLIVLIWGFTGVLGKSVSISPEATVVYRMGIAFLGLLAYLMIRKQSLRVSGKALGLFLLNGVIIAAHWGFFFKALKVSNVSVTLACLSSASLFMALLEPIFFRRKIIAHELVFGALVIVGIYVIFQFETQYIEGIIYSVVAAFLASLFTAINGLLIREHSASTISLYEMLGGTIATFLFMAFAGDISAAAFTLTAWDVPNLLFLALVCTALAFAVSVDVMKELSPFSVSITVNLEPIYGIVLALIFFGQSEYMSSWFYIGALIILITVFGDAYLKSRRRKKAESPSA